VKVADGLARQAVESGTVHESMTAVMNIKEGTPIRDLCALQK
jgi:hypothetical protein